MKHFDKVVTKIKRFFTHSVVVAGRLVLYLCPFRHSDSSLLDGKSVPVKSMSVVGSYVWHNKMTQTFGLPFS